MKKLRKLVLRLYRQVLSPLPLTWVAEMFRIAGDLLGVRSCTCAGELGTYEASLYDRGVMGYYLVHHTWEPRIQALLATMCGDGMGSFIDIGANIGLTTIPLKKAFPGLNAICVEADSENFQYLRANMARAGLADVVLHNCAVHSTDGEIEFERSDQNAGDHRIRLGNGGTAEDRYGESRRAVVRVSCSRLESLVDRNSLAAPVGMKCDIQGAEVHFLRGAGRILEAVDWLIIEFWPYGIARAGTGTEEFFNVLASHFPFAAIIESDDLGIPRLEPIENAHARIAEKLRREGETAHGELLFAKTRAI